MVSSNDMSASQGVVSNAIRKIKSRLVAQSMVKQISFIIYINNLKYFDYILNYYKFWSDEKVDREVRADTDAGKTIPW